MGGRNIQGAAPSRARGSDAVRAGQESPQLLEGEDSIMIKQQAQAVWTGGLKQGAGSFRSGTVEGKYSFASRFEGRAGSTPEALIGAAHAACFSMALSLSLEQQGHTPDAILIYRDGAPGPAAARHHTDRNRRPRGTCPVWPSPSFRRSPRRPGATARCRRPWEASRSCSSRRS